MIRARSLGLVNLVALGEYQHPDGSAGSVRQHHRATDLLIRVTTVTTGPDVHLNRLVKLCHRSLFCQRNRLHRLIESCPVNQLSGLYIFLTMFHDLTS